MEPRVVPLLLILVALTGLSPAQGGGCPFCKAPGGGFLPLQTIIEWHGTVVLARLGKREPGARKVRFVLEVIVKGAEGLSPGDEVLLEAKGLLNPRLRYLVLGEGSTPNGDRVWPMSPRTGAFMKALGAAPPRSGDSKEPSEPSVERLVFFMPYVGDPDPWISGSARKEFSDASYARLRSLRPHVNAKKLLEIIGRKHTIRESRETLLVLVGVAGDAGDAEALVPWMKDPSWQRAEAYPSLVSAYLSILGEAGLDSLRAILGSAESNVRAKISRRAMRALRFQAEQGGTISKEAALGFLRSLLTDLELARFAISELCRLEDWESLPQVIALHQKYGQDHIALTTFVGGYLIECPRPEARRYFEKHFIGR